MTLLYLFNFLRTILIIIGIFFVLRLIGRMMVANRNLEEQERLRNEQAKAEQERLNAQKNYGKTTISRIGKKKMDEGEYVDYEEIDE